MVLWPPGTRGQCGRVDRSDVWLSRWTGATDGARYGDIVVTDVRGFVQTIPTAPTRGRYLLLSNKGHRFQEQEATSSSWHCY